MWQRVYDVEISRCHGHSLIEELLIIDAFSSLSESEHERSYQMFEESSICKFMVPKILSYAIMKSSSFVSLHDGFRKTSS
jgi:hypothetical protein